MDSILIKLESIELKDDHKFQYFNLNLKGRFCLFCFVFKLAQVFNKARAALGFARDASVAAVQNEPVVDIQLKFSGNHFE